MSIELDYIAAVVVSILFVLIALFQVLLVLGLPLGEFAMGGYHKILPSKLRIVSAINALILLFMAIVVLQHTSVLNDFSFLPTSIMLWFITIFLGLNTIANIISQSRKEKLVMTPLSSIAFILCFIIAISP